MTAVASAHGANQLGNPSALTDGYSAAFIGAAGIAVVGAVLAAIALRFPKQAPSEQQSPDEDRELVNE